LEFSTSHSVDERSNTSDLVRVHLRIVGKVQGVYFRNNMKLIAAENNVKGWVRNLREGSVEAILEGKKSDVHKVIKWSHSGPTNAVVAKVTLKEELYNGDFSSFEIIDA
jgi:acylphosphatase